MSYLRDNLLKWVIICIWRCSGRGFVESSITISGLKAQLRPEWTSDTYGTRFTATVHPIGTGPLLVAVAAGAAADASGNTNLRPSAESKVLVTGGQVLVADAGGTVRVFSDGMIKETASLRPELHGLLATRPDGSIAVANVNGTALQFLLIIGAQMGLDIFIFLDTNLGLSEIMAMAKGIPYNIHFVLSCTDTMGLAEAPSLETAFFCET
eukprot:scaffold48921_cov35-Prasinocladus_malaysianus.AAC.2